MEDDRYMHSMLLDFYGELLTDKQRECYDLHFNDDYSLAEIAEQSGISRQAVWDNIRRAESFLMDVENKTGLIARFTETQQALALCKKTIAQLSATADDAGKAAADEALQAIGTVMIGEKPDGV